MSDHIAEILQTEARYAVYLERQRRDIEQLQREEASEIPGDMDFSQLAGLSNELKAKLSARRPRSLAQAQSIDGMTPSALAIVLGHIRRDKRQIA